MCEDVENDIEVRENRERNISSKTTANRDKSKIMIEPEKVITTFFRYRNTKTYGFTLENYSFELLLQ